MCLTFFFSHQSKFTSCLFLCFAVFCWGFFRLVGVFCLCGFLVFFCFLCLFVFGFFTSLREAVGVSPQPNQGFEVAPRSALCERGSCSQTISWDFCICTISSESFGWREAPGSGFQISKCFLRSFKYALKKIKIRLIWQECLGPRAQIIEEETLLNSMGPFSVPWKTLLQYSNVKHVVEFWNAKQKHPESIFRACTSHSDCSRQVFHKLCSQDLPRNSL